MSDKYNLEEELNQIEADQDNEKQSAMGRQATTPHNMAGN